MSQYATEPEHDTHPNRLDLSGARIKIVWIAEGRTSIAEREIEIFIREGWHIVTAGGGSGRGEGTGFVILQKNG